MENYHRQAILENSYSSSQSSFACSVKELPFLACLDIGSPGTFTGNSMQPAIDWNTPAPEVNYKNLSFLYLEGNNTARTQDSSLFGINCSNAPPSGVLHGDGVINSYDIGVLVFALFQDAPYDQLPADEANYNTVTTVEQRPETQSRCGDNETRADWQVHLYDYEYCPAIYANSPPPPLLPPPSEPSESSSGRMLSALPDEDDAFVRTRFVGANALGSWYSFEFATNIIPIVLELIMHGIWVTERSQLSNAPAPRDSREVPISPELFQLRWARTARQLDYAYSNTVDNDDTLGGDFDIMDDSILDEFATTPTCKSIVSGGTGLRSIMGDTISVRQEGPGSPCPFWLFLWVPEAHSNPGHARVLTEDGDNAHHTLFIWPKRGSTAMTTSGGVLLKRDASQPWAPYSPSPSPPPPSPPPTLPPPSPPPMLVKALNATQEFNIDNEVVTNVVKQLELQFAIIKANLLDFVFDLTQQIITVRKVLAPLPNIDESSSGDEEAVTDRRLSEDESCNQGAMLKILMIFVEPVSGDVIQKIKDEWPNITNYKATTLNECSEVVFEEERVPVPDPTPEDDKKDMPILAFVLSLLGVCLCCSGVCLLPWLCRKSEKDTKKDPKKRKDGNTFYDFWSDLFNDAFDAQLPDSDGSPLLLREDWPRDKSAQIYTRNGSSSKTLRKGVFL